MGQNGYLALATEMFLRNPIPSMSIRVIYAFEYSSSCTHLSLDKLQTLKDDPELDSAPGSFGACCTTMRKALRVPYAVHNEADSMAAQEIVWFSR